MNIGLIDRVIIKHLDAIEVWVDNLSEEKLEYEMDRINANLQTLINAKKELG